MFRSRCTIIIIRSMLIVYIFYVRFYYTGVLIENIKCTYFVQ